MGNVEGDEVLGFGDEVVEPVPLELALSEEVEQQQSWGVVGKNVARVRALISRFGIRGLLAYNAGKAVIGGGGAFLIYDGPPEEKAVAAGAGVAAAILPSHSFWVAIGMIGAKGLTRLGKKDWESIAAELDDLEESSQGDE